MNNRHLSAVRLAYATFVSSLKDVRLRLLVLLALFIAAPTGALAQSGTTAGNTPAQFQTQLDGPATKLCGYAKILPQSKWVTLGAFVLFLFGVAVILFGGRGGNVFLARAIGIAVLIPAILGIGAGLGIGC